MKNWAKLASGLALSAVLSGCMIQHVDDGEPRAYRVMKVPAGDVAVYTSAAAVPGRFTVIEEVWVKDDGNSLPRVLLGDLRERAGATGANAVILASTNRELNGTRADWRVQTDNPFDYFAGTAIWVGDGPPPIKVIRP